MLRRAAPRLVSFEEQVAAVREALAMLHEQQEDWAAAAQTLAGIDLDSGAWQTDAPNSIAVPTATCSLRCTSSRETERLPCSRWPA